MAAIKVISGVYREIWTESDPHMGGQQRTITTGIRASASLLSRMRADVLLQSVTGSASLVGALTVIDGFLAIVITNTGLNNTSATYSVDVSRAHSAGQAGDRNRVALVYVVGNSGGSSSNPAMTATPNALVQTGSTGNVIVVAGANTAWAQGITSFTVSSGTLSNLVILSPTSATFTYAAPVSAGPITVSDGTINNTFNVVVASMSVAPNNVVGGSIGNVLTLTGVNTLWTNATNFLVSAGTKTAQNVINSTSATITFTAPAGNANVTISGGGQSTTFTVTASAVPSMVATPVRAVGTNTTLNTINLVGTNTTWTGATVFTVSGGTATAVINSNTSATLTYAAPGAAGVITVSTGGISATFNVATASMTSVPNAVVLPNTTNNTITITGTNTNFVNGTTTFSVSSGTRTAQNIISATSATITFTSPLAPAVITVTGGGQTSTFSVGAVSFTATPSAVVDTGSTGNTIVLTGINTTWVGGMAAFTVSDGTITNQVVNSATQVTLTYSAPLYDTTITLTDPLYGTTATFELNLVPVTLWQDQFTTAATPVGNYWAGSTGNVTAITTGGALRRTDTGSYGVLARIPTNAELLPADYTVTFTVPNSMLITNYWGITGRFGAMNGVRVLFTTGGTITAGDASGPTANPAAITVTGGLPGSWALNQNHTVGLEFVGTRVGIMLDGVEYGFFTSTVNAGLIGTGVGILGEETPGTDRDWLGVVVRGMAMGPDTSATINFTTTGATFQALLDIAPGGTVLWTYDNSTTSTTPNNTVNYGAPGAHTATLQVTPWSALESINVGYGHEDNGSLLIPDHPQQNVTAITGLRNARTSLEYICVSHNVGLTYLNVSDCTALHTLEAFESTNIFATNLYNTPSLTRLCHESNNLAILDLSSSDSIADVRGAANPFNTIVFDVLSNIWHLCVRNDFRITHAFPAGTLFGDIVEWWNWQTNQSGALVFTSTTLRSVQAYDNRYTSLNISGCMGAGRNGEVLMADNLLTSINISNCPGLVTIDFSNNALNTAGVDSVLAQCVANGMTSGTVDLRNNMGPSGAGGINADLLRAAGVTVYTDAVLAPTMTALPAAPIAVSSTGNIVNISGSLTSWTGGTSFSITSGGGTITAQSVTDSDTAQITFDAPGAPATITISDGSISTTFEVAAGGVLWQDDFNRANGAVGNNWAGALGGTGAIVTYLTGHALSRTDTGDYRVFYNPVGGVLPANYTLTVTIPHALRLGDFWGITTRWLGGTGVRLLHTMGGTLTAGGASAWDNTPATITVTNGYPASWATDQDHTVALEAIGTTIRIILDGIEYGTFISSINNVAGTGVGCIGEGNNRNWLGFAVT